MFGIRIACDARFALKVWIKMSVVTRAMDEYIANRTTTGKYINFPYF